MQRTLRLTAPLDVTLTLRRLQHGRGDPTIRLGPGRALRASRNSDGPSTLRVEVIGDMVELEAWGSGAEYALESAPTLLGFADDPGAFTPDHSLLRRLGRSFPGIRIGSTGAVFEALVPTVIEQRVTGADAAAAYRALIRAYGEPAPGPGDLLLPIAPTTLAGLAYHVLHPLGIERRRADVLRKLAALADRLESLAGRKPDQATRALQSLEGIGPWTAAEVARVALGDKDAVSVGDYHLPNLVSWALANQARGDDARMLELLEPYRGQRARVIDLLEVSGITPPRYGPRAPRRSIARI